MSFEIRACTIDEITRHPSLHGRTQGKVKVTLRETRAAESYDHDLTVRVWAETTDAMSQSEINSALLGRAAVILKRTVAVAEQGEIPNPVHRVSVPSG